MKNKDLLSREYEMLIRCLLPETLNKMYVGRFSGFLCHPVAFPFITEQWHSSAGSLNKRLQLRVQPRIYTGFPNG